MQEFAGGRPEAASQALLFYMERCRVLDAKPGRQPGQALALEVPTADCFCYSFATLPLRLTAYIQLRLLVVDFAATKACTVYMQLSLCKLCDFIQQGRLRKASTHKPQG